MYALFDWQIRLDKTKRFGGNVSLTENSVQMSAQHCDCHEACMWENKHAEHVQIPGNIDEVLVILVEEVYCLMMPVRGRL